MNNKVTVSHFWPWTWKWRGGGVIFPYMDVATPFSRRLWRRVVFAKFLYYHPNLDEIGSTQTKGCFAVIRLLHVRART